MKPARIVSAQAIDHPNLIIKFTNNELKKYDTPYVSCIGKKGGETARSR